MKRVEYYQELLAAYARMVEFDDLLPIVKRARVEYPDFEVFPYYAFMPSHPGVFEPTITKGFWKACAHPDDNVMEVSDLVFISQTYSKAWEPYIPYSILHPPAVVIKKKDTCTLL
jgi:hypothetical protein